ncbi:MAG TPA: MXAN_2562 family outer membrane beta-barrel protein [Polyangiaceae bacterium]|nr:MXAN_2562 family outer membrane beta-barrel protein [Polyangiaceae bacterium]
MKLLRRAYAPSWITAALLLSGSALAHEGEEGHTHPEEETPAPAPEQPEPEPLPEPTKVESTGARPYTPSRGGAEGDAGPRRLQGSAWRQRLEEGREKPGNEYFEPLHFVFELRFGPYMPQVDEEFEGRATPYTDFFGDDPLFYFGLELDWLPLHIPYVGSIGVGFGWGFTSASGNAIVEETGAPSDAETSLDIFPMHASGVVRFDGLLRKFNVPVVPHVKVGFGFGLWSADGPSGTSAADGVAGEGISLGMHLALGGSVALNGFDAGTAKSMRDATGIRYAYLWGEWMYANLDGMGSVPQMHVGTSTGVVGLGLDF